MPGHTLLLADDSITIHRIMALALAGANIRLVSVADGDEAVARIPLERPDLVIADITMPKRSGYDVSAFVKGRLDLAHIPVLLLAAAFEPADQSRVAESGCDGVLIKPFEPGPVAARVRELLARPQPVPGRPTAAAIVDATAEEIDELPPSPGAERGSAAAVALPTLDAVLGEDGGATGTATSSRVGSRLGAGLGTFEWSEAPDAGDAAHASWIRSHVAAAPAPAAAAARPEAVEISDALVAELTRRVTDRIRTDLGATTREVVAQVVAETAEKLLREEIARIRSASS